MGGTFDLDPIHVKGTEQDKTLVGKQAAELKKNRIAFDLSTTTNYNPDRF